MNKADAPAFHLRSVEGGLASPGLGSSASDGLDDIALLIAATAQSDRAAFTKLYQRTSAKLLGVIFRILNDRGRSEDVLQDVFVRVWQGAGSYDPSAGRPMTWLITIARNRAIDVVRQRRDVQIAPDEDGTDWLDNVPDPRDREADFLDADRLRICLDRLDEKQRSCLLAAYYHGFSREELATRFDKPVNTIKTWLHRSALTLRACLGEP
jgi:RNA polymerase sigma-70 factor (ECF subfamily)